MFKRFLILSVALLLAIFTLSGCSKPEPIRSNGLDSTIKVGLILPLKGEFETYGMLSKKAIDLAIDEINSKGGILGHRLEAIPGDDASNVNVALHAAERYAKVDQVPVIIGPYTTQSSIAVAPVAQQFKVPMIAIRASEASITKTGEYVFRACYVDTYQGTILGRFAGRDLKAKRAAVIYNSGDLDAVGLVENFKKELHKHGGKVESVQSYDSKVTDFTLLLREAGKVQPDVILLPDFEDKAGRIIKRASEMRINCTFLGTDFWNVGNLLKIAGDAAIGSYFTGHFAPDDPYEKVQEFVNLYEGDYGVKPGPSSALSYDAVYLVVEAMRRSNSTDPEKIRDALAKIRDYKGVTGTFSFDEERNPIKGGIIMKVIDGGQAFEKRIDP